jgi:hypothetical protein
MKNTTLIFEPHQIAFSSSIAMFDVEQVMMDWEASINASSCSSSMS